MKWLYRNVPFTYAWMLRILLGTPKTVLDLGCGVGHFMDLIKNDDWEITGIDIHKPTVDKARKSGIYDEVLYGDLVKQCRKLIRAKKKFDLVFCSQVIEHITRSEGEELLELIDRLYSKTIYVGTPRGYMEQPEKFLNDDKENKYQVHKSGWSELDFTSRNYKVYGVGFEPVWSETGLARTGPIGMAISAVISYFFAPITLFVPSLSSGIMAVKTKQK